MKKIFLAFLFCLPLAASAQTKFGLRGGGNLASIRFYNYNVQKKILPRFNIGTIIEIPIEENWYFLTGPHYSGKGVKYGKTFTTGNIDSITVKLNYIQLPLEISYKFCTEQNHKISLSTGLYLSYGFNGKIITINSFRPPLTQLHKKATDQYKRLELGYTISSLYEIKNQYGLRLDLTKSLTNIQRIGKQKNIVFGFSFFFYFKNKHSEEE